MHLIVVHHHLRPGGVRRVIELALPHVLAAMKGKEEEIEGGKQDESEASHRVTLACGEAADLGWNAALKKRLWPSRVEFFVDPSLQYLSEQRVRTSRVARQVSAAMAHLLGGVDPETTWVWAHNLGLARNLLLTEALGRECTRRGVTLIAHHHDWWFDHRWQRWPEIRDSGFRTLAAASRVVFPASSVVRHAVINSADATLLGRHLSRWGAWLPNLMEPMAPTSAAEIRRARRWMSQCTGDDAPVWLVPCRVLRRKNIAEALLLTRWLRPEAWLATTGGTSSADERYYSARLQSAAARNGWRLRLGLLAGAKGRSPSVPHLLAASEAVLLTSVQEGFGLPYLEAVAAGRPLVARSLPNVAPDLARFGFRLPQTYTDLRVDPSLFDVEAERRRQWRLLGRWQGRLPSPCRGWVETPSFLEAPDAGTPVAFSRLTLTAQVEVLEREAEESFERCARWNPFLRLWRSRAAAGRLRTSPWPRRARTWLGGERYGRQLALMARRSGDAGISAEEAETVQRAFMRERLQRGHQYPLLWDYET